MDEYSMSWSDAIRAETDFLDTLPTHHHCEDLQQFGTLGRALWRERSLTWVLGLAAVRADEAQKIISSLHAAFRPLSFERAAERAAATSND